MTSTNYPEFVASKVKAGSDIMFQCTPLKAHLNHMAMGVCGEAGELVDAIKKFTMYNKPLDRANVVEELGDLEFYMEGLRASLKITREETLAANQAKLSKRYKEGFTDAEAAERSDKKPTE